MTTRSSTLRFCLTVALIATIMAAPATPKLQFQEMPLNSRLTSNQINAIGQDLCGRIYFGTATGLNRYDGYNVTPFHNDNGDNYIQSLFNHDGMIWMLTGNDWTPFNPDTGQFTAADSLPPLVRVRYIHPSITDALTMPDGQIAAVNNQGALLLLDSSTANILQTFDSPFTRTPAKAFSIAPGNQSILWIYSEDGIRAFNMDSNSWESQYRGIDLTRLPIAKAILHDSTGNLWIGFDHDGILVIAPDGTHTWVRDNNSGATAAKQSRSLSSNSITALFEDRNSTIWVGTRKSGILSYNPRRYKFDFVAMPDINCIVETTPGILSLGTDANGLIRWDTATGQQIVTSQTFLSDTHSIACVCMTADRNGNIWIGSYNGGLRRFSPGKQPVVYTSADGLISDNVWDIIPMPDSRHLMLATIGGGLQLFDPQTGNGRVWNSSNSGLQSDYIANLAPAADGTFYLSTSIGLSRFNPITCQISTQNGTLDGSQSFSSTHINQVMVDNDGLLWLATYAGLDLYDPENDRITHVELTQGPVPDFVLGLAQDHDGDVWATVGSRLVRVRKGNEWGHFECRVFDDADGLPGCDFNQRSLCVASDGRIYAGGLKGVSYFYPSNIDSEPTQSQAFITAVTPRKGAAATNRNGEICLKSWQNEFTVSFANDNYLNPDRTIYNYTLQGYSNHPSATAPGVNEVAYTNLSPGTYIFHVNAVEPDGSVSDAASISILIASPFYASWWAQIIYLALLACTVILIMWIIRRRERNASMRREHAEQTRVLSLVDELLDDSPATPSHAINPAQVLLASDGTPQPPPSKRGFDLNRLHQRVKDLITLRQNGAQQRSFIDPEPTPLVITSVDEQLVEKAVRHVEKNIDNPDLSVEELASHLGMSRVHLYKRLKAITGKTPIEFIRLLRLKRAAQLLRESQLNVSEIAYQCGFNNPKYFSRYFKEEFGDNPSAYQEKQSK